ncbi:hypothetical protein [Dendronalium sp. ChiSLP03b]
MIVTCEHLTQKSSRTIAYSPHVVSKLSLGINHPNAIAKCNLLQC